MKNSLIKRASIHAIAQVAYIASVALLMSNAEKYFGNKEDTMLAPITFLLLFVISALISGLLILGKPILLFLDGSKNEAVTLLLSTLGFLIAFFIIGVFIMILL